jgi:RNase P/RNase MRP subunit p29
MIIGLYVPVITLPWKSYKGILGLVICITESLLVSLEAKMETYRYSTGSQFNVIFK